MWGLDIILPQFGGYKFRHGWFYFIGPETANNDNLLQLIEFFRPGSRHRNVARVFAVINRLKVFGTADKSISVE